MAGSFETDERHPDTGLRPLRVASRREEIYGEAKDMVADLRDWALVSADDDGLVLTCERKGGLLKGRSTITIRVEGPEGIPSATVHVKSITEGGVLAADRQNVQAFLKPFTRRVC